MRVAGRVSNCAFGGLVGETYPTMGNEGGKSGPGIEHVIHIFADGIVGGEQAALFTLRVAELLDEWGRILVRRSTLS